MAIPFPELTQFKTREEQDQEIRVSERPSVYRQLTRGEIVLTAACGKFRIANPRYRLSREPGIWRLDLFTEKRALATIPDRTSDETTLDPDDETGKGGKGYIPFDGGLNELEKQATLGGKTIVSYPDGGVQAWLVVLGGFLMVFSGFGVSPSIGN